MRDVSKNRTFSQRRCHNTKPIAKTSTNTAAQDKVIADIWKFESFAVVAAVDDSGSGYGS